MMNLPLSDILPCGVCEFSKVGELIPCRAQSRIPENAKSVIMYLFPYFLGEDFYENSNISKYAVPADYHVIADRYLEKACQELESLYPENRFSRFCDNSPIREVEVAVLCGLGVKGRNGLLINEKYGSFCFIGEIITDKEITASVPEDRTCIGCGICEKKCPLGAISGYKVDVSKCLSHITQKKGELSQEERKCIEETGCIWGCDICQNVCPMNKNIEVTPIVEFIETAKSRFTKGDNIEDRAFNWRGRAVIERNFEINCCKDKENKL
jgi:epoxyqueuosine reductase QueG